MNDISNQLDSNVIIPITYKNNPIPMAFSDAKLMISGADLIIQRGDEPPLTLPLAAKLAALNQHAYTLVFDDGVTLNANALFQHATIISKAAELVEQKSGEIEGGIAPMPITEQVYIEADIGAADIDAQLQNNPGLPESAILQSLPAQSDKPASISMSKSSGLPPEVAAAFPPSDGLNVMGLSLLQTAGMADQSNNIWLGGSGNLDARHSQEWLKQYTNTEIDLSNETADWTVYVNNFSVIPQGMVGRVLRIDESQGSVLIEGLPQGFQAITANSPEGKLYELQANEFLLLYPQNSKASFELTFTYTTAAGVVVTERAKFVIVDNPTAHVDSDGRFQLATSMNSVDVKTGSGDDHIIAGYQKGSYDGGAGQNTLDYHQIKQGMTIDLKLGISSVSATDDQKHTLKNIQTIIGTDYGDTLIGNQDSTLRGGKGDDLLLAGAGNNTLDGGLGINTLSYANATGGVSVDLSQGRTHDNGMGGSDSLKNINHVIGSDGDDILIGDDRSNRLLGGAGDDILMGLGGDNYLDGGEGTNTVSYERGMAGVKVDLSKLTAQNGFGGTDTLINIQQVIGSAFDDELISAVGIVKLFGGDGNDTLIINGHEASRAILDGGVGDDLFIAGKGVNHFIGGGGFDTLDYSRASKGIDIDMSRGQVFDNGFGGMDTLEGISQLIGSNFNDRIVLGNGNFHIKAGGGDDLIIAGSGNNYIDGQQGVNTVDYSGANRGINVDLISGKVIYNGFGGQDNLANIQQIVGSDYNDVIAGDHHDNIIYAGAGSDLIYGSLGNDSLYGGSGSNTLDYSRLNSAVIVNALLGQTLKSNSERDVFQDFNAFVGTKGDDVFIAARYNLQISGGAGMDTVDYSQLTDFFTFDLRNRIGKATGNGYEHQLSSIEKIIFPNAGGNNGYTNSQGNTWFIGARGNDKFFITGGSNTIDGNGGNDSVSYAAATTGVRVELDINGTGNTTNNGFGGQDRLIKINNLIGSSYNDYLAGVGRLEGRGGNDTIVGIGNNAIADYGVVNTGVVVNLATGITSNDGYGTKDTLVNINHVYGSNYNDTIWGNDNNNVINTYNGNDYIYGSKGIDSIDGGSGIDTLDYSLLNARITADLSRNSVDKGGNGKDTVLNMENIVGTNFDDILIGNNLNNVLTGGDGDDILIGNGGNDVLIGGSGFDTASYSTSPKGIVADLHIGQVADGFGGTDILIQIDKVLGSNKDDIFNITSANDLKNFWIDGAQGRDSLIKKGMGDTFDFSGSDFHVTNIEKFNFADNAIDNITLDLRQLFAGQPAKSTINFQTDSNDIMNIFGTGWSLVSSGSQSETWSNGSQNFEWSWA